MKHHKGFRKVMNVEFTGDEIFTNIIPDLETEHEEPICYNIFGHDMVLIWRRFRKQYKLVIAGGGIVRNKKDKILFIFRNGRWDLPKGKAEDGEMIEETALREVKEECGLNNLKILYHVVDTYHTYDLKGSRKLKKTSWYQMYCDQKELVPQEEEGITKIKWVKEEKMEKIYENTYPSIIDVLHAEEKMRALKTSKGVA